MSIGFRRVLAAEVVSNFGSMLSGWPFRGSRRCSGSQTLVPDGMLARADAGIRSMGQAVMLAGALRRLARHSTGHAQQLA